MAIEDLRMLKVEILTQTPKYAPKLSKLLYFRGIIFGTIDRNSYHGYRCYLR